VVLCRVGAELYPVPETTGAALFTYAMAYGTSVGLLDHHTYLPVVQKAWQCLSTVSLHPDGTVGNCQPVGYQPLPNFGRESTSSFCVGQFAMAAAEVAELAPDSKGMPWS
jgi:rhamnogalacturonyl hydrolase YesR